MAPQSRSKKIPWDTQPLLHARTSTARRRARAAQLQAAASTHPGWSDFYLDYRSLKQILRQISPRTTTTEAAEAQSEGDAQLEGLFLSSLLLEIRKVDAFFHESTSNIIIGAARAASVLTNTSQFFGLLAAVWAVARPTPAAAPGPARLPAAAAASHTHTAPRRTL